MAAAAHTPPAAPCLVTVTRFWGQGPADLAKLSAFVSRAREYSDHVVVAVREEEDRSGAAAFVRDEFGGAGGNVHALPVRPWGKVTAALNAATEFAVGRLHATLLLFQSLEVVALPAHVDAMRRRHMDESTFVVGAALQHGQRHHEGEHELDGMVAPWNTLALWRAETLAVTGFLSVSDGLAGQDRRGEIEEVPTIALLQWRARSAPAGGLPHLAKLVRFAGEGHVDWRLDFMAPPDTPAKEARRERHRLKMESKSERAEAQLEVLALPPATVLHVCDRVVAVQSTDAGAGVTTAATADLLAREASTAVPE